MRRVDTTGALRRSLGGPTPECAQIEVSIVIPCQNNEASLVGCIRDAQTTLDEAGVSGEVIVADYGSSDGSLALARKHGVRIVVADEPGYGAAVRLGVSAAHGRHAIVLPADGRFDVRECPRFIMRLRAGADMVVGCRWAGGGGVNGTARLPRIPRLMASLCDAIASRVFGAAVADTQCAMRAFRCDFFEQLELHSVGVEIDSESIIKAALLNGQVTQAPVTLHGEEVMRGEGATDGWRRLKPLILMCPQWTLMFPAYLLMMLGVVGFFVAAWDVSLAARDLHVLAFAFGALGVLLGFQLLQFGLYAKAVAGGSGILPDDRGAARDRRAFNFERGVALGAASVLVGGILVALGVNQVNQPETLSIIDASVLGWLVPGATLLALGIQFLAGELTAGLLSLSDPPPGNAAKETAKPSKRRPERRQRRRSPWEALSPTRNRNGSLDAIHESNTNQKSRRNEQTVGTDASLLFSHDADRSR